MYSRGEHSRSHPPPLGTFRAAKKSWRKWRKGSGRPPSRLTSGRRYWTKVSLVLPAEGNTVTQMTKDSLLIAVVDDEDLVRKALGRLIRAAGFHVETFSTGADFLRSLQQHQPDCAVLDLRMPLMSGLEVQKAITKIYALLPVVIITGDDSVESRTLALKQGAAAYLRKPVDEAVLIDAIRNALRARPSVT
jgi:CheY-like chemotaxis protein